MADDYNVRLDELLLADTHRIRVRSELHSPAAGPQEIDLRVRVVDAFYEFNTAALAHRRLHLLRDAHLLLLSLHRASVELSAPERPSLTALHNVAETLDRAITTSLEITTEIDSLPGAISSRETHMALHRLINQCTGLLGNALLDELSRVVTNGADEKDIQTTLQIFARVESRYLSLAACELCLPGATSLVSMVSNPKVFVDNSWQLQYPWTVMVVDTWARARALFVLSSNRIKDLPSTAQGLANFVQQTEQREKEYRTTLALLTGRLPESPQDSVNTADRFWERCNSLEELYPLRFWHHLGELVPTNSTAQALKRRLESPDSLRAELNAAQGVLETNKVWLPFLQGFRHVFKVGLESEWSELHGGMVRSFRREDFRAPPGEGRVRSATSTAFNQTCDALLWYARCSELHPSGSQVVMESAATTASQYCNFIIERVEQFIRAPAPEGQLAPLSSRAGSLVVHDDLLDAAETLAALATQLAQAMAGKRTMTRIEVLEYPGVGALHGAVRALRLSAAQLAEHILAHVERVVAAIVRADLVRADWRHETGDGAAHPFMARMVSEVLDAAWKTMGRLSGESAAALLPALLSVMLSQTLGALLDGRTKFSPEGARMLQRDVQLVAAWVRARHDSGEISNTVAGHALRGEAFRRADAVVELLLGNVDDDAAPVLPDAAKWTALRLEQRRR